MPLFRRPSLARRVGRTPSRLQLCRKRLEDEAVFVLGSGTLGLVYLMERSRLTLGGKGCAFGELVSFHGGMGGSRTRAFILTPAHLQPQAS